LVFSFGQKFAGVYDLEARFRHVEVALQGGAILLGVVLFAFLYRSDAVNQFMAEVVVELSRVTWPTQRETRAATILVVIMVLLSGVFLGLLDYFWTVLLKWII